MAGVNTTISVICTVSSGETFQGWFKVGSNARQITTKVDDRVNFRSDGDRHTLKLNKIQDRDWGVYECRATSGAKKTFTLSILRK
jgi:hypothetical protein